MLARTICFLFAIAFVPLSGLAGDVVYRLDANALKPRDECKALNLPAIEFQDRIWATPGIEQATVELDPPKKWDFQRPQRVHIVHAPGCREFFQHKPPCSPDWLDETALPRTRQMFDLGYSSSYSEWDSPQLFSSGGVTLQR